MKLNPRARMLVRARRGAGRLLHVVGAAALVALVGCATQADDAPESSGEEAVVVKAGPGDKAVGSVMAEDDAVRAKAAAPPPGADVSVSRIAGAKGVQQLPIGSTLSGELTPEDVADNPVPVDWWTFELATAGELTLEVASAEINPMVKLFRDGQDEPVEEYFGDDGVLFIFDVENGSYAVAVLGVPSVLAEHMGFSDDPPTGSYGIGLDFRPASEGNHTATYSMLHTAMGGDARELGRAFGVDFEASGPRNSGELRDGTYFEDFPVALKAGETVTVTMRSIAFDTFLLVLQDEEILASNDDAGGSTDSQITFTAPSAGTYVFRANSFEAAATGTYSLIVDR